MKTKTSSVFNYVLLGFCFIILITMAGYGFYYSRLGTTYYDDQAQGIALVYSRQSEETVDTSINGIFLNVRKLAEDISAVSGSEELKKFGENETNRLGLVSLQFLKENARDDEFGEVIGYNGRELLEKVISSGKFGNSGIYTDAISCRNCVAVYCPVYGNAEVDGIIAYCPIESFFGENPMLNDYASYCFFAGADGSIIDSWISEEKTDSSKNIFTYIYNLTESKTEADAFKNQVVNKEDGFITLNISGEKYIGKSFPIEHFGGDYFIFQLFKENTLLQSGSVLSKSVFAISAIIVVFSCVALVLCVLFVHSNKKKLQDGAGIDPVLGCNTYNRFALEARSLLDENKFSRYAIVNFDIYKFQYLRERLSSDEVEKVLKYISKVCTQITDANETFGRVTNDSFVILMHYTEIAELAERIKLLGALVSNYSTTEELGMDIRFSAGIYPVERERNQDIQKMLGYAKIALQINKKRIDAPYTVYDASIASAYIQEAELEVKMNLALKNRDFKLFFQPKYSIANDCIESAEVLVRWYNPETQNYIAPDRFIRLFEANGFVSELDHYVFEETCRFLNDLTEHGEKVVPLSVNVSRATAIKPDFINFYINKKKEYGIEDGFITLEFTETFASESYDLLGQLLAVLKSNGFKSAIDDFGMGNSSLVAVKELPVDELKFDRILIKHSGDTAKDDAVLKMLINVSKEIGMTVTQEGVETREDMDRLRELGCDIIQGYYYSKPMQIVDFIDFLKDDTSLAAIKRFDKTVKV